MKITRSADDVKIKGLVYKTQTAGRKGPLQEACKSLKCNLFCVDLFGLCPPNDFIKKIFKVT